MTFGMLKAILSQCRDPNYVSNIRRKTKYIYTSIYDGCTLLESKGLLLAERIGRQKFLSLTKEGFEFLEFIDKHERLLHELLV